MTDKQINQRIAEACGWKCAGHPDQLKATSGWEFGYQFVLRPDGQLVTHNSIPDFCNNLNAMHEAEKSLKGYEQIHTYVWHLNNRKDWETDFKLMEVHISARHRAEAFLRALGKWEEVQG